MKLNYAIGDIIKYTGDWNYRIFIPQGLFIVTEIDVLSYKSDAIVHTKNIKTGKEGLSFYNSDNKVLGVAEYTVVKISD